MKTVVDSIAEGLEKALRKLQADLRSELKAQGHYNTGKLHDSIVFEIERGATGVTAFMYCEDYGLVMEFGIPAGKIPYSRGSGAGSSKYIEGLFRYFETKGLDESEARSAAFATAQVQKREGLPTTGSYAFSSTGARTGFAETTLERDLETIGRVMEETTGFYLNISLGETVKMQPIEIFV